MSFPRLLVVVLGKINAGDATSNGLLLRNLFCQWPRTNLAQVYSSGESGDEGAFGRYYKLGPQDRRFGHIFYRLKAHAKEIPASSDGLHRTSAASGSLFGSSLGARVLFRTGLYELVFRPRLSRALVKWVEQFQPQLILAQGYNLTFTWLPLAIADHFQLPLAYYPSDDWPGEGYEIWSTRVPLLSRPAWRAVDRSSRRLVESSALCVAFSGLMREEYFKRYGRDFVVLMHGDDPFRFQVATPCRRAGPGEFWIVSTGTLDNHRWPLIEDLEQACGILNGRGVRAVATVFLAGGSSSPPRNGKGFRHVGFEPCPSHSNLVSVLRGADVLFLPERFDDTVDSVRLSVSSKAHLFMFSGRPIVVYSDSGTGISRYAHESGWAAVVSRRDPGLLADSLERLARDGVHRQRLVEAARRTAMANHDLATIQQTFLEKCRAVVGSKA